MGTDDLRKKRKTKIRDRKTRKNEYEAILIVCEGEKTEINYLKQLKNFFRLNNITIDIIPSENSSPLQVVKFAKKKNDLFDYNEVYCVFDKDTHANFIKAQKECEKYIKEYIKEDKNFKFEAIISNPCFEFWILLHFTCTTKPFGTNSPCNELINKDLKIYIKDYKKDYNFTNIIKQNLSTAITNARKANKEAEKNNYESSYTFMDKLAIKFQELNNAK
ncbi:RloB domain-containing protein [Campylobacter coli]|uniref:RloB n=2 Tax=Campylobacter jejuni TaxID=197 RepID=Q8G8Y0_CAMJU|nr:MULTISPECIES: RloB family protein [Campylobacter]WPM66567.1 RloB family protein [Campylobacter sp. CFSAN122778]AAN33169.1 RloB [Campylobacter jejuni]AAN33172.1 RloB [Campylobacter jejuni]APA47936.1 RloB [Campylobacter jejuni]ASE90570.1 RloB [Campylobacter jejuni]